MYLLPVASTVPGGRFDPLYNVLASHITQVGCVNFICEWRDLQFNVDSERQIFLSNFFKANFIYPQSFCQKSTEIFIFSFNIFALMPDLGYEFRALLVISRVLL